MFLQNKHDVLQINVLEVKMLREMGLGMISAPCESCNVINENKNGYDDGNIGANDNNDDDIDNDDDK